MINDPKNIEINDLTVGYDDIPLIEGINFNVKEGEIVGIFGRNGSGKSTIIRTLTGIQNAIDGDIRINGYSIGHIPTDSRMQRYRIGCLPQHNRNFSSLTVRENLHLALWRNKSWKSREEQINEFLKNQPFIVLSRRLDEYANTLSGGQDLLLGLAVSLLQNHKIIILDEPSDGLDELNKDIIIDLLLNLKKNNKIIILVEQILKVLFSVSDRVMLIRQFPSKTDSIGQAGKLIDLASDNIKAVKSIYEDNRTIKPEHIQEINALLN